jgi:hypothetical protein
LKKNGGCFEEKWPVFWKNFGRCFEEGDAKFVSS